MDSEDVCVGGFLLSLVLVPSAAAVWSSGSLGWWSLAVAIGAGILVVAFWGGVMEVTGW